MNNSNFFLLINLLEHNVMPYHLETSITYCGIFLVLDRRREDARTVCHEARQIIL
jgi:hypothetical protein